MIVNDGDSAKALDRLGRASTPGVARNPFNIKLIDLLGCPAKPVVPDSAVIVGDGNSSVDSSIDGFLPGIPGLLVDQVSHEVVTRLIIDFRGIDDGPWCGVLNSGGKSLRAEILEASKALRAKGFLLFIWSTDQYKVSPLHKLLNEYVSVDFAAMPAEQLEEKAKQSGLWQKYEILSSGRGEEA